MTIFYFIREIWLIRKKIGIMAMVRRRRRITMLRVILTEDMQNANDNDDEKKKKRIKALHLAVVALVLDAIYIDFSLTAAFSC